MKTTVDIPDNELREAMRLTKAKTKREAIVTAVVDFNRRHRMARLIDRLGTCQNFMSRDDLDKGRSDG